MRFGGSSAANRSPIAHRAGTVGSGDVTTYRRSVGQVVRGVPERAGGRSGRHRAPDGSTLGVGMATEPTTREERLEASSGPCRPSRASTCSAARTTTSSTSARRSRCARAFARISGAATARQGLDRMRRAGRADRGDRHAVGGRGAPPRAEPDQAPPAAVQRPAARRQVVSVHRRHRRRTSSRA